MAKEFDDKENTALLFKEDGAKQKPTDREFSGHGNLNGVAFWISAWKKTSKTGKQYLSLALKLKNEAPAKPPLNDDIGF